MSATGVVIIDDARGEAVIGPLRIPVAVGRYGELRVGGPAGPLLRPAKFAERWQAATRAAPTPNPVESLCAALVNVTVIEPGGADRTVVDILALHLAGAGAAAPPYAESILLVARAAGWSYQEVNQATALDVDHLAQAVAAESGRGPVATEATGWQHIIFRPAVADEEVLAALRVDLARDLLARGSIHASHTTAASALAELGRKTTVGAEGTDPLDKESTPPAGAGVDQQRVIPSEATWTSAGTEDLPSAERQQPLQPGPALKLWPQSTEAAVRANPLCNARTQPVPPRFVWRQASVVCRVAPANPVSPPDSPHRPSLAEVVQQLELPGTTAGGDLTAVAWRVPVRTSSDLQLPGTTAGGDSMAGGDLMAVSDTRLPRDAKQRGAKSSVPLPSDPVSVFREDFADELLKMSFAKEPVVGSSRALTADVQNLHGLSDALAAALQDEADARGLDR